MSAITAAEDIRSGDRLKLVRRGDGELVAVRVQPTLLEISQRIEALSGLVGQVLHADRRGVSWHHGAPAEE